ncbi:hypothetical protein G4B88_013242 [Cannabis sativa]|uniref:Uncharacterized protein n=1 Tax=Cannabis sativa TaxID=3483 RepID=A0A7J6GZY5_CANSA|nr:hypothetical protein G4B88_013242 [Cannabis sativa]
MEGIERKDTRQEKIILDGETRENAGSCYRTNAGAGDVETNGRVTAGSQVVAPVDAEGHIATLKHNETELSSLGMVVVFDLTMPP